MSGSPADVTDGTTGRRLLVLSTVHQADDPRIRLRTVGVLAGHLPVRYATQPPGPVDQRDHTWVPLRGDRVRRNLAAVREAWRPDVALLSVHDPELLPLALAARWLRRVPVVFDVHEDVPGQLRTKTWLPRWLRLPLAALAAGLFRVAERSLLITLAEPGYRRLFARDHPVLPNYPLADDLPDPVCPSGGDAADDVGARDVPARDVVYVGDVTEARGALFAVEVVARLRHARRLRLIGRCPPALRDRVLARAAELDVDLHLPGFVPHPDAMRAVAGAAVGLCPLEDQPNYRHSLPTKVLEYLAVGVPVVASDLPGTAELAAGRPGVQLVAPRDGDAWAAAIDRAITDPDLRAAARSGASDVRATFAWPARRLVEIYTSAWTGRPT